MRLHGLQARKARPIKAWTREWSEFENDYIKVILGHRFRSVCIGNTRDWTPQYFVKAPSHAVERMAWSELSVKWATYIYVLTIRCQNYLLPIPIADCCGNR